MDNKFELLSNEITGKYVYRRMEIEWKDKFIVVKCEYIDEFAKCEWNEDYFYQEWNEETEEYDEYEIKNPEEFFGEDFEELKKFIEDNYADSTYI